ncbi:MAG: ribonuclease P protein component [Thermotogae bacterium]|nr:ribonuclease P protein component [Thermotogota bacterium]
MRKHTLKKREILRKRSEIRWAFKNSRTVISNDHLIIRWAPHHERKVLFAVERHVRKAVKRNRIKRKLREFYRLNKDRFPKGIWILIGKRSLADLKGFPPLPFDRLKMFSHG